MRSGVVVAGDERRARIAANPGIGREYHPGEGTKATLTSVRWTTWVFVLLTAALRCDAPVCSAQPAPPAPEAPASSAAPTDPGNSELPYQLWPAEVISSGGVVVSGSEPASKAGAAVLEAGGNAVDAAVATAFALGVTEPMTSGLGAETFILIYGADGLTHAIDGSCVVPTAAQPDELQRARTTGERSYIQDHRSAAVPGSLAALAYALERYGTRSLAEALAPAIELAEFGYTLNPSAIEEIDGSSSYLRHQDYVADLFLKNFTGTWGTGRVFCASDLAKTLRRVAELGPDEFYRGKIADQIDADMRRNGGFVRKADLARVRAVERQPIRDGYRGLDVVTFPYPGGGGSLVEMLHILETFPAGLLRGESLDRLHLLIEAARIVRADNLDPRMPRPLLDHRLTDRRWAEKRARLIRFDRALSREEIGSDEPDARIAVGTTQVSVVDRWGNVVALSQTLGAFFGATVATPGLGFLYNANLNAFNYTNPLSPNYLRPGQVPTTAMTPTIVLKDGKPLIALGSAGSDRVVPTMVSVISAVADRGLDPCEAVAVPRAIWGTTWEDPRPFVEVAGEITPDRADALEKRGFRGIYRLGFPARWVDISAFGGTNAVFIDPQTGMLAGVPDPRRLGAAAAPPNR